MRSKTLSPYTNQTYPTQKASIRVVDTNVPKSYSATHNVYPINCEPSKEDKINLFKKNVAYCIEKINNESHPADNRPAVPTDVVERYKGYTSANNPFSDHNIYSVDVSQKTVFDGHIKTNNTYHFSNNAYSDVCLDITTKGLTLDFMKLNDKYNHEEWFYNRLFGENYESNLYTAVEKFKNKFGETIGMISKRTDMEMPWFIERATKITKIEIKWLRFK